MFQQFCLILIERNTLEDMGAVSQHNPNVWWTSQLWIGLRFQPANATWQWTDGSDFDYENWHNGNFGDSEYCVSFITKSGTWWEWNAINCDEKIDDFICKIELSV